QFSDVSVATGVNYSGLGMGVDFGDFNRDGWLDLYITNLSYNTLYLNNADGTFSNIVVEAGVGDTGMGWSTAFLDCDNDGWQDIYMVNGPPTPNILYQNLGDNTFSIASAGSPLESYGNAFGMACTDLDNDGRMDLFVANSNDAVGNQLFRNENTDGFHWLKVRTRGVTSNRAGIGARVEVEIGGELLVDEVAAGTGYASQNSLIQHFGLGDATTVDRLTVRWPSGQVDVYENLEADRQYLVVEGESLATAAEEPVRDALQLQVWPNPVQTELSVRFSLEKGGPVYLEMRDALGRPIARQSRIFATAGEYQLEVPTADLPAGTYALT
ncbi:MAG: CRTAC1 family protein, partial [Saprospiraceae bacterium]|nr:CRTAC1 family protein [Saprospiraceae bacterium]